jgi:hypothetical protein
MGGPGGTPRLRGSSHEFAALEQAERMAQVQEELQMLSQTMGHEDAILSLAQKYGDWVMDLL